MMADELDYTGLASNKPLINVLPPIILYIIHNAHIQVEVYLDEGELY